MRVRFPLLAPRILVIARSAHDYKNPVSRRSRAFSEDKLTKNLFSKNKIKHSEGGQQKVQGARRSRRAGADCKSVVLRLRWFESTHSHQKHKPPFQVVFVFAVMWFMVLGHTNAVCLVRQAVDFASETKQNRNDCPTAGT